MMQQALEIEALRRFGWTVGLLLIRRLLQAQEPTWTDNSLPTENNYVYLWKCYNTEVNLLASFCSSNSFAMSESIEPVSKAWLAMLMTVPIDDEPEVEPVMSLLKI